jgi:hypothetical protein
MPQNQLLGFYSSSPAWAPSRPWACCWRTTIEERRSGSDIEAAIELAGLFRLTPQQALCAIEEVDRATSHWQAVAKTVGLQPGAL